MWRMHRIAAYLDNLESLVCISDIVAGWNLIERRVTPLTGYWHAKLLLKEGTGLYVTEYVVLEKKVIKSKYKYHWQDKNGNLIARWDNVPHHPEISSFPHHKHVKDRVQESKEFSLEEILDLIRKERKWTALG